MQLAWQVLQGKHLGSDALLCKHSGQFMALIKGSISNRDLLGLAGCKMIGAQGDHFTGTNKEYFAISDVTKNTLT